MKRQKNDRADAGTIAEAASRPSMRFVAVTSTQRSLDKTTVFEKVRILRPKASDKVLNRALANIRQIFPALEKIRSLNAWPPKTTPASTQFR